MTKFLVGKKSELAAGSLKQVKVEGHDDIAVANVGGKIYAMRGLCNHMGGPLGKGRLEGNVITCPWHGSKWDVETGKCVQFQIKLDPEPVYKIVEDGDNIYVEA